MANPLFNNMNNAGNGKMQFLQKLQQLKARGGDPNQQIQELLNSGKVSQSDYDRAVKRAEELRKLFGM